MKKYYVYILECADKSYYVGITNSIARRFSEHQKGIHVGSYTSYRRPVKLVYFCEFENVLIAIKTEKKIKKWSRLKKEALISGAYERLPNLSKKRF